MKRKIFAVFTALTIAISLLPTISASATGYKKDDTPLYYSYSAQWDVVDCDEDATMVVIPEKVDGSTVIQIKSNAFADCTKLKSVTIPNTVRNIQSGAFKNCTSLESIIIPESVTSIGTNAFEGCTALKSITIPKGVTKIGNGMFKNCTSLMSITLHDDITSIHYAAFAGTGYYDDASNWEDGVLYIGKHLIAANENVPENCTIKDGTSFIAQRAFYDCETIKKVIIPESVATIEYMAFYGCKNLSEIQILNDNSSISSKGILRYCVL